MSLQNPPKNHYVTTFYHFFPISKAQLLEFQEKLKALAQTLEAKGLVILGPEGINSTCSFSNESALKSFKNQLELLLNQKILNYKDSISDKAPFRKFVIKVREEIVTLGTPELIPNNDNHFHLTPAEWNHVLKNESDYVLIDTRNWYEYQIGTFKGALNPNMDKFTDFKGYLDEQQIPKDKKMLIFCTGGVRCEKGILELQRQGYNNVYQLKGGILQYLKESPNDQYEGECFVFDHRVALDQNLEPSKKYGLCPHCGQPGQNQLICKRCDFETLICEECAQLQWKQDTCSKNCAYHYQLHPERKAAHQYRP